MATATPAIRAIRRLPFFSARIAQPLQASSFATSSRVTLDLTRPALANAPRSTSTFTVDAPSTGPAESAPGFYPPSQSDLPPAQPSPASPASSSQAPHQVASHLNPAGGSYSQRPASGPGNGPSPRIRDRTPGFGPRKPGNSSAPGADAASADSRFSPALASTPGPNVNTMTAAQREAYAAAAPRRAPWNDPSGPDPTAPYSHVLGVHGNKNNVRVEFTDRVGVLLPTITGGKDAVFKKGKRREYESGVQAATKMFKQLEAFLTDHHQRYGGGSRYKSYDIKIKLAFYTAGKRCIPVEAVKGALLGPEGEMIRPYIIMVEDRSKIKIGGDRPRRVKRR